MVSRRAQQSGRPGKREIAANLGGKSERRKQLRHGRGIAVPAAAIMTAMDTPVAYFGFGPQEAVASGNIYLVAVKDGRTVHPRLFIRDNAIVVVTKIERLGYPEERLARGEVEAVDRLAVELSLVRSRRWHRRPCAGISHG